MYVHPDNNPGNIEYDSFIYVFVKSWFIPVDSGGTSDDKWLRIAARSSTGYGGQKIYTPININVETISSMVISEDGKVIKAPSVPTGSQMPRAEFTAIQQDAFDIGEWEQATGQAWPYAKMTEGKLVRERYQAKHGTNPAPFGSVLSENNIVYNKARAAVMSRPCNCGKK